MHVAQPVTVLSVLSVVDKWLTDAPPVTDKRLTYVLSVVDKWLTDARCTTCHWQETDLCTIYSWQMTDWCTTFADKRLRYFIYYLQLTNDWLTDALPVSDKTLTLFTICSLKMKDWCLPVADKRLTFLLSVVAKWLTDALPVADKRQLTIDWLMHYLSLTRGSWQMTDWCITCRWQEAVGKWLTDALPVADRRLTYSIPVADGDTEGDESTVGCQPALQAAAQQRCVDVTPADRQHHPCHRIFYGRGSVTRWIFFLKV